MRRVPNARRLRRAVRRPKIGVSIRGSLHALGRTLEIASLALALPALVAAIYRESPLPFLIPLAVGLALGYLLERTNRGKGRLGTREVFLIVVLAWLAAALLGSCPYLLAARTCHPRKPEGGHPLGRVRRVFRHDCFGQALG